MEMDERMGFEEMKNVANMVMIGIIGLGEIVGLIGLKWVTGVEEMVGGNLGLVGGLMDGLVDSLVDDLVDGIIGVLIEDLMDGVAVEVVESPAENGSRGHCMLE